MQADKKFLSQYTLQAKIWEPSRYAPTEKYSYCAFCGTLVRKIGDSTCRPSCFRKLNGITDEVTDFIQSRFFDIYKRAESAEWLPLKKHDIEKGVFSRLNHAVQSPAHSITEIGNELVVSALKSFAFDGFVEYDISTYEKLVGNGWIEFNDNTYWNIRQRAENKQTKPSLPWLTNTD